jgi:hypothetical protein
VDIEMILVPVYGWQRGVFEGFATAAAEREDWQVHLSMPSGSAPVHHQQPR